MEKCYTVAETVKLTGVKSYVLRYWEDELSLPIRRNELGHRCYTQDDIQLFLNIKELKDFQMQEKKVDITCRPFRRNTIINQHFLIFSYLQTVYTEAAIPAQRYQ